MIRTANPSDLDALADLYAAVIGAMNAEGLTHWDASYPARSDLEADVERGAMWVADAGGLMAAATFDRFAPTQYDAVRWRVPLDRSLFVHRLAVRPAARRRGLARALMDAAERVARERGLLAVKLDAYRDNPGASALYPALGYTRTGEVRYPPHPAPFVTFERVL